MTPPVSALGEEEVDAEIARVIFNRDVGVVPTHKWVSAVEPDGWCGRQYSIGYGEHSTCFSEDAEECSRCGTERCPGLCETYADDKCDVPPPRYASDIACAFLVVEAMRARDLFVTIKDDASGDDDGQPCAWWDVTFFDPEEPVDETAGAQHASLPRAICLAALAATRAAPKESR